MALVRERQKRQYDIKTNKIQYLVVFLVWLHDPTTKKGFCRKLQLPWEGPYQGIQILSDLVYAIKLSKHTKSKIVHHDRLKAYFGEPETYKKVLYYLRNLLTNNNTYLIFSVVTQDLVVSGVIPRMTLLGS